MSEISFQAMQFAPRFLSVLILLVLTWLVAKFVQYMFNRAIGGCQSEGEQAGGLSRFVSRMAFWAIFVIMLPFVLNAAGISISWLNTMQQIEGQIFAYWPVWVILSMLSAGVVFVLRGVPRLIAQVRGSFDTPGNGIQG